MELKEMACTESNPVHSGVALVADGYREEALTMLHGLRRQIKRTLEKPGREITGQDLDLLAIMGEVTMKHVRRYVQVASRIEMAANLEHGYADDQGGTRAVAA